MSKEPAIAPPATIAGTADHWRTRRPNAAVPRPTSLAERLLDLREMVPAVAHRMVLDNELRRDGSPVRQPERRGRIELRVAQRADGVGRRLAVLAEEVE